MATNNMINRAYSTTPTATTIASWDANKNLSAVGFIPGYDTTATAGATTTLSVGSNQQQFFTGSSNQTLVMPVASTLVVGQYWSVVNNSTGTITIQSSGGNTILALGPSSETVVTCILNSGTSAASWTTSPAVSGSGTVSSGLINQLAWYAANGNTVSGLTTANNGVLVTSNTGVPSISSTLPTNTAVTSPKIVTSILDTNGNKLFQLNATASAVNFLTVFNNATTGNPGIQSDGSDSNVSLTLEGKGTGGVNIVGYTDGSSAVEGSIGQLISSVIASASAVSLSTGTSKDVTSISLSAGDWDVWGNVFFQFAGTPSFAYAWISTTSATLPDNSLLVGHTLNQVGSQNGYACLPIVVRVSTTTTVYLSGDASFTSTCTACGGIYARRRR